MEAPPTKFEFCFVVGSFFTILFHPIF
jgi:hypothetical protein